MSPTGSPSEYLLLFRGCDWKRFLSPAEIQRTISQFLSWCERLHSAGTLRTGRPLLPEGRVVAGPAEAAAPEAEWLDEDLAGYFLVEAATLDAAVSIAQQCPMLAHGATVEVRPIASESPSLERTRQLVRDGLAVRPRHANHPYPDSEIPNPNHHQ